ncbi:MAG: hypothetical protein JNL50_09015, partial [Phycisphaerae bacterium]|nr:hypothetical protein [Phycisphaerae bacterium]
WPPRHAITMTRAGDAPALELRYFGEAKELPAPWTDFVFSGEPLERADAPGGFILRTKEYRDKPGREPSGAFFLWAVPRLTFGQVIAI